MFSRAASMKKARRVVSDEGVGDSARAERHRDWKRRTSTLLGAATVAVLVTLTGGCGAGTSHSAAGGGGPKVAGGTATFAMPPGNSPDYIFPLDNSQHFTIADIDELQYLLYRPLYWFGVGAQPLLNENLSLAYPPSFSANGQVVTVRLKHYMWSDGVPVTTRDVEFWQNLVTANKENWGAYAPGAYPDNITSTVVTSPTTVVFHLNRAYNQRWFLYNELSQITPLPTQAWDKVSANGPVGKADLTSSGAVAVYNYLAAQSGSLGNYATNPLWKVVDGPWTLSAFSAATGSATFSPNPHYSGPIKPSISKFVELGFTSDTAEYNQLLAGGSSIDVGYVPFADVPQKSRVTGLGYTANNWISYGVEFFDENYNNPTVGPIFKQLYVRQAFQYVMDQTGMIHAIYKGYADPTYGPVPTNVPTSYASAAEQRNPYPFDPAKAAALLKGHGWSMQSGVAVCTSPGSAANDCGPGVASGARMSFSLIYASGDEGLMQEMSVYKSDAAEAGIEINLSSEPFSSVVGDHGECKEGASDCNWEMINWNGGWGYEPDFYPTGEEIFATGAGSNRNNYSDAQNDANIRASYLASVSQAQPTLTKYENYLELQLPVIWQPATVYQITVVTNRLHGVYPQNSVLGLNPEQWYFTGSK